MNMLTVMPLLIGTTELLLIAGLALLLFGGKKLPEMMRGMGRGIKSFKEGMNEPLETNDEDAPSSAEESASLPAKEAVDEAEGLHENSHVKKNVDEQA